jgi:L-ascorbate metabolism protein UlaG (beta-lactamase superfamily)
MLFPLTASSKAFDFYWMGVTCVYIDDGETGILFDPFFTRPNLWEVITFQKKTSDKNLVQKWLKKTKAINTKAIFVTHSHYDHVFDLGETALQTNAQVYGNESALNIARGHGVLENKLHSITGGKPVLIGKFKITALPTKHSMHLGKHIFFGDKVTKPLSQPASFNEYEMGNSFNYYIEHPNGNILFHASGLSPLDQDLYRNKKADIVFQGIAKRASTKELIHDVFIPFGAKIVIPMHFDNFLRPLSKGFEELFIVDLNEFKKTMFNEAPGIITIYPKFGEKQTR